MADNGFPQFSDGNVEIHFTASENDKKYVLHSWLLSLHSPWFKASLSERWKTEGSGMTVDGKHHWIYELRFEKDTDIGTLVQKSSSDEPRTVNTELLASTSSCLIPGSPEPGLEDDRRKVLEAHQNIFRALYHREVTIPMYLFDRRVSSLVQLARAADLYGCERIMKLPMDDWIQDQRVEFEENCKNDPGKMIEVSTAIKSKWVFCEAAIHLIGRSERFFDSVDFQLEDLYLLPWFLEQRTKFTDKLRECELDMFRLEPEDSWMGHAAMNFFRHWLSEQLKLDTGSGLCPGYANLYHSINERAYSYKASTQKEAIRKYTTIAYRDSSEKLVRELEPELKNVYAKAADVLQYVLRQNTRLQSTTKNNHRALTFTDLDGEDMPWEL